MASWVEDVGRRAVSQLECGATALPTSPDSTTTTWMPHLVRIHINILCYAHTHTRALGLRPALLSHRPWRALHRIARGVRYYVAEDGPRLPALRCHLRTHYTPLR